MKRGLPDFCSLYYPITQLYRSCDLGTIYLVTSLPLVSIDSSLIFLISLTPLIVSFYLSTRTNFDSIFVSYPLPPPSPVLHPIPSSSPKFRIPPEPVFVNV
jgi:hypothetical protein